MTGLNPLLLAQLFYLLLFGVAQTIVFDGRSVLVDLCHVLLASINHGSRTISSVRNKFKI